MCSPKSLHNLQLDEGDNYMAETETEEEKYEHTKTSFSVIW